MRRGKIPVKYAKRDTSEKPIKSLLTEIGATYEELSISGGPDLLVGFRGVNYLFEVKTGKGKVRDNQETWHERWRGGKVYIARTPEEVLEVLGFTIYG